MLRENDARAANVRELLEMNGGNSSGHGIGCVSWDGTVHPDQFWRQVVLGNVRDTAFSRIWADGNNEVLTRLRQRKSYLTGRCATCRWLSVCNGNLRARAEAASGDVWAWDPACYLTDEEIGQ
jgi:radical SAM protein with 4Fe4S-binding SPASM domain